MEIFTCGSWLACFLEIIIYLIVILMRKMKRVARIMSLSTPHSTGMILM